MKHIFDPHMVHMLVLLGQVSVGGGGEVYSGPKSYIIVKIGVRTFLGMPDGILELQYYFHPHMARSWL